MAGRACKDWLSTFIRYTENTESPVSYYSWSGISAIAGALQRQVYMHWGHEKIYPNQYIVLVGPAGRTRKGLPLGLVKAMLYSAGIPLTAQRITREALIKFMKNNVRNFSDHGKLKFQAAVTCVSAELSVFLGQKDTGYLADLTDWYDAHDKWKYETKNKGEDDVLGMCFNFLAATAPDWLPSILPHEAIGGGYTSRVIFVVEEDKRKIVANPNSIQGDHSIYEDLVHDLEIISTIIGEYTFDDEALASYEGWYQAYEEETQRGNPPIPDPHFAAYCSRRGTHIKKIAMALTASRTNRRVITKSDFDKSLTVLEAAEKKMTRVFRGLGRAKFAEATEIVLNILKDQKEIRRSTILCKFYRDIDAYTLEQVEKMLDQMKVIRIVHDTLKRDVLYRYIGD